MPAAAQSRNAGGEWTGKYVCGQGVTGARLILSEDGSRGVFHFYALPENPGVPEGCYQVTGIFNNVTGALATLAPFGVDVSSGVEFPSGGKDPRLIRAFVEAVRTYDHGTQ